MRSVFIVNVTEFDSGGCEEHDGCFSRVFSAEEFAAAWNNEPPDEDNGHTRSAFIHEEIIR